MYNKIIINNRNLAYSIGIGQIIQLNKNTANAKNPYIIDAHFIDSEKNISVLEIILECFNSK